MENWTAPEWLFVIGVGIILLVLYVKRDKVKSLLTGGGGKRGDGDQKPN